MTSLVAEAIRKLEQRVNTADKSRGYDNWPRISQAEAQALLDVLRDNRRGTAPSVLREEAQHRAWDDE